MFATHFFSRLQNIPASFRNFSLGHQGKFISIAAAAARDSGLATSAKVRGGAQGNGRAAQVRIFQIIKPMKG